MTTEKWRPFRPANAPDWDHSYGDPPSIRHDCFSVERLFVVPWGSGEGEVGRSKSGGKLVDPEVVYLYAKQILLWDVANERVYRFDLSGQRLETKQAANKETAFGGNAKDDYPVEGGKLASIYDQIPFEDLGYQNSLLPDGRVICASGRQNKLSLFDPATGQVLCRVYYPWVYDPAWSGLEGRDEPGLRGSLHPDGLFILPHADSAGIEFYLYRLR